MLQRTKQVMYKAMHWYFVAGHYCHLHVYTSSASTISHTHCPNRHTINSTARFTNDAQHVASCYGSVKSEVVGKNCIKNSFNQLFQCFALHQNHRGFYLKWNSLVQIRLSHPVKEQVMGTDWWGTATSLKLTHISNISDQDLKKKKKLNSQFDQWRRFIASFSFFSYSFPISWWVLPECTV